MRDHSGLAWCQIQPQFPGTRRFYFSSTQSSKVDCIDCRLCIHPFTNFPAISIVRCSYCCPFSADRRSRLCRIDLVQGGWMPPWSCSSISWGLKLVKLLMTCILGWDCIAMCVWNLRIFVSELYRYDLALQITTLDNRSWSNGHQKTRTHHIFPGFWITTLLHCNAPLL